MSKPPRRQPLFSAAWIVLCAFLNCAGWFLSGLSRLNLAGYSILFLTAAVFLVWWWRAGGAKSIQLPNWYRLRRRFRRWFPRAFLFLAALAFLGGVLHAPSNYDALSYRLPRILNWLAAERWHWIHTEYQRLNVRACGIEWVSAPLILFTGTDRFLFLINIISFLLLPGLIFGAFTRLGVSPRVAWHWMWLAPAGLCFVLQAGSIGNDMFSAVFGLAALELALRARTSHRLGDVWLSLLAAALLTGGKTSNLPLLLPWAIAILPALPLVKERLISTAAIVVVAAGASFLPVAAINLRYCGDWTGAKAEQNIQSTGGPPALHVFHNTGLLALQNLAPPVFPLAGQWNRAILEKMPPDYKKKVEASFENGGAHLTLPEMQVEEDAGLGSGVSALLLICLGAKLLGFRRAAKQGPSLEEAKGLFLIRASGYVSLLVFMVKSGLSAMARLITPYYLILIPALVAGKSTARLVRNLWWRRAAMLCFLMAGVMLIISPARPLWPARTVLAKLDHGQSASLKRAKLVYDVYAQRSDAFAPLLQRLPADSAVLGLLSFDDPETSLWRPFGHRLIVHILPSDTPEELGRQRIKYVLVNPVFFLEHSSQTPEQWLEKNHAELVESVPLTLRASHSPVNWMIVRLPSAGKN